MSSITASRAVSSMLAPASGAAGGSQRQALGHVTVAFMLLGVYGVQVCPFIETLSPLALLLPIALLRRSPPRQATGPGWREKRHSGPGVYVRARAERVAAPGSDYRLQSSDVKAP